jgi:hypothetical protein
LSIAESCAALGISADLLTAHVLPSIRVVKLGRRTLVPTSELQRWLEDTAEDGGEQ